MAIRDDGFVELRRGAQGCPGGWCGVHFGGSDVPLVQRRSEERCGAWRLVAECYVDGRVHGFAMHLGPMFKSKQMMWIYR